MKTSKQLTAFCQVLEMTEANVINLSYGLQSTTGNFAGDGLPATSASLNQPGASWISSTEEAYIADSANCRIRNVDTSGIITTYFGNGGVFVSGNGGSATSAGGRPTVVTGDTAGNVYFSDNFNSVVRKIDTSLIVTAFAGGGSLGSSSSSADNGAAATAASFSAGYSIFADTSGNVYIGDNGHNKIKKVSPSTHILTYVAGTGDVLTTDISSNNGDGGQATAAITPYPGGLFIDSSSMLYFLNYDSGIVRKINLLTGIVVTFAGGTDGTSGYSGDGGPATSALLQKSLAALGGDLDGRIYYSAKDNHNVRVIDTVGIISRFAGDSAGSSGYSGNGGEATAALISQPMHVFAKDNVVYITESGNNVVRSIGITLISTSKPSGGPTTAPSLVPSTIAPTVTPSLAPSFLPTMCPSAVPTVVPSLHPTQVPSVTPSTLPSIAPSLCPSVVPSVIPSLHPSQSPSTPPSTEPSLSPSAVPSCEPSVGPSLSPFVSPTQIPTVVPTIDPSCPPSVTPSQLPSQTPSIVPSKIPTVMPTLVPTTRPTVRPSRASVLSVQPTAVPTTSPTVPIVVISFDSSLYLHNVSASSLDVTSQNAVTSSVAVTLNISTDQVSYVSQQLIGGTRRRLSASSEVYQIEVTVNVVASTADFVDAVNRNGSYLYHLLSDTLTTAVASNAFTRTVREQSAAVGALSTLYVGHVNVTVTTFEDVTPDSSLVNDEDNDSNLSTGEYVGIVIGIIVSFLSVFVCFCVDWSGGRRRGGEQSKV